jgi:hypothetical protein
VCSLGPTNIDGGAGFAILTGSRQVELLEPPL